MVASVAIYSYHGAAGATNAAVAAVRFKKADNDTADTNNRLPIPSAGSEYSYVKHLAPYVESGTYTLIDTVQAYGDGALPTGIGMYMADAAYTDPTTQVDTALGSWADNYATYVSGSPLSLAGSSASNAVGKIITNYLQMQMQVGATASAGVMAAETLTFSYLES